MIFGRIQVAFLENSLWWSDSLVETSLNDATCESVESAKKGDSRHVKDYQK